MAQRPTMAEVPAVARDWGAASGRSVPERAEALAVARDWGAVSGRSAPDLAEATRGSGSPAAVWLGRRAVGWSGR